MRNAPLEDISSADVHKLWSWYFNIYKKCLVEVEVEVFRSAQQISANSPTVCVQLVTVYLVANGTAAVFPMKRKDIITPGCQDPKFMLPQGFRSQEGLVSKAIQGVFGGEWASGCGWPTWSSKIHLESSSGDDLRNSFHKTKNTNALVKEWELTSLRDREIY